MSNTVSLEIRNSERIASLKNPSSTPELQIESKIHHTLD